MATDVSGTIHIIAEVMGEAGSPIAGTGAVANGSEKRKQERLKISVLGMAFDVRQVVKYLTIGGLISNSQFLGTMTQYLFYLLGILGDVVLRPILPLLLWTMGQMLTFLTYIGLLIEGEKSFSDVWGDWTGFWKTQWEEGGLLGILKDTFKLGAGLTVFGTIIGGLVAGPAGASFVLSSVLSWSGGKFGLDVISNVVGIKKAPKLSEARKGTKAARTARYIKQKALKLGSFIGRVVPIGKALVTVGVLLSAFALNTIAQPNWGELMTDIKNKFFSVVTLTWTSVLNVLGIIAVTTTLSLLDLIEFITFGALTAEEVSEWLLSPYNPLNVVADWAKESLDEVSDKYDDISSSEVTHVTGRFLDKFFNGSITVGKDFMNVVTDPLENLNR
jgi:hypothetical protein